MEQHFSMKIVKKRFISIIAILFLICFISVSLNARAHSPSGMSLDYNSTEEKLSVSITHSVSDPNSHYIKSVVIKIDGNVIETKSYTTQPSSSSFTYEYELTVNEGSTIEVTAECSIAGSITRSLTLGDDSSSDNGTDGQDGDITIPGYFGLWIVIGVSFIISLAIFIRKLK